jgi:membrane protease YdiL (CAAX protease family)
MSTISTTIHIIVFSLAVTLMAVVYPVTGYRQGKSVIKGLYTGNYNKVQWYKKSILWSWIPVFFLSAVMLATGVTPSGIGFRLPSAHINNTNPVIFKISLIAATIYIIYSLYSIISFRISSKIREHHAESIPSRLKYILPVSKKEKRTWFFLSFTAGFTEEFLYRGYLFFAIPLVFGRLHPAILILASTLLFAAGHIYQGKEVIKPSIAGLFLALLFYFTGSLYIVILLHFLQDLIAGELLVEPED